MPHPADPYWLPDKTEAEQLAEAAEFRPCPVTLDSDDVCLLVDALRHAEVETRWMGLETLRQKCGEQREYPRSGKWVEDVA